MLSDNLPAVLKTLEQEKMYVETIFREMFMIIKNIDTEEKLLIIEKYPSRETCVSGCRRFAR